MDKCNNKECTMYDKFDKIHCKNYFNLADCFEYNKLKLQSSNIKLPITIKTIHEFSDIVDDFIKKLTKFKKALNKEINNAR